MKWKISEVDQYCALHPPKRLLSWQWNGSFNYHIFQLLGFFVVTWLADELSHGDLCLFCLAGIHLVPENEQLLITKVDEHERTSTFSYRSDPESDIIFPFVAVYRQRFWLTSVLWLLSELAIEQFGKGRF